MAAHAQSSAEDEGANRSDASSDLAHTIGAESPERLRANLSGQWALPKDGPGARSLLSEILSIGLINPGEWENAEPAVHEPVGSAPNGDDLLRQLGNLKLLTLFQVNELRVAPPNRLIVGNYRLLDRLGAGGGGIVYKAQHLRLRRLVALKVLLETHELTPHALIRSLAEIEAVGELCHPNIVSAFDAGEVDHAGPDRSKVHYLAMEYIPGQDLMAYVNRTGPMAAGPACALICQVAGALGEAHRRNLIHRDVKPSNVLVTAENQAKLLDFGLARRFGSKLTQPGIPMGTLDYMAPEQVRDASAVDARTDVFGLGGTLFWALTGKSPFATTGSSVQRMMRRLTAQAPSIREVRPELPPELDAIVRRMLALNPDDRYPDMDGVLRALTPFLADSSSGAALTEAPSSEGRSEQRKPRLLIVDDDPIIARISQRALQSDGLQCDQAGSGAEAFTMLARTPYDLVLLDVQMPGMSGAEVLASLRSKPPLPNLKVIMCSGSAHPDEMAQMLQAGADDYLTKPISVVQLQARVTAALTLKAAQDRTEALNQQLRLANAALGQDVVERDSSLIHARSALVLALARLVELRTQERGARWQRLQRYCAILAEAAATTPAFAGQIDLAFTRLLETCAPLHDIGKVALPDHILMKVGKYDPEEHLIMETHTTIGADTLREVADRYHFARPFLDMAIAVARSHHERWDGTGYPDRLAGATIPLAARIVALGDVYDALRCRRTYRPAFAHPQAVRFMHEALPGHFDPNLMNTFNRLADQFERIFQEGATA